VLVAVVPPAGDWADATLAAATFTIRHTLMTRRHRCAEMVNAREHPLPYLTIAASSTSLSLQARPSAMLADLASRDRLRRYPTEKTSSAVAIFQTDL
jgi:hypothetical protein